LIEWTQKPQDDIKISVVRQFRQLGIFHHLDLSSIGYFSSKVFLSNGHFENELFVNHTYQMGILSIGQFAN
jgi:hypothetical protein